MRLLLRATNPRISRLFRRVGLRKQNYGQGRRAGTSARRAVQPEMATASTRHERRDRQLSTGGEEARAHAPLPGSVVGVSQPGGDRHEKLSRDEGHRYSERAGALSMRRRDDFIDDLGS